MKLILTILVGLILCPFVKAQNVQGTIVSEQCSDGSWRKPGTCPSGGGGNSSTHESWSDRQRDTQDRAQERQEQREREERDQARAAAAAEHARYMLKSKHFQKLLNKENKQGDSPERMQQWLALYMQDGWGVEYYNYAMMAWRLKNYDVAIDTIQRMVNGCRSGAWPVERHVIGDGYPSYDSSICADASRNLPLVLFDAGYQLFLNDNNTRADAQYYLAAIEAGYPHPWANYNMAGAWVKAAMHETNATKRIADLEKALEYARAACRLQSNGCSPQTHDVVTNRYYYVRQAQESATAAQDIQRNEFWTSQELQDDAVYHLAESVRLEDLSGHPGISERYQIALIRHVQGQDAAAAATSSDAVSQIAKYYGQASADNSAPQKLLDEIYASVLRHTGVQHYDSSDTSSFYGPKADEYWTPPDAKGAQYREWVDGHGKRHCQAKQVGTVVITEEDCTTW